MNYIDFSGCPYENNPNELMLLDAELERGETLTLGDILKIEPMDDSFIKREVLVIDPKRIGALLPFPTR